MFTVETVNRMRHSERICCYSISFNNYIHRNTSKTQQFALIEERSYLVLNEEERKQERKANRIFTLGGKMTRGLNFNLNPRKRRTNAAVTAETTKRL